MSRLKKHARIIDIMGWYGMAAVLVAYGLVNLGVLPSSNVASIALNLTGSIGLLLVAVIKRAHQLAILNTVWALIAIVALLHTFIH